MRESIAKPERRTHGLHSTVFSQSTGLLPDRESGLLHGPLFR